MLPISETFYPFAWLIRRMMMEKANWQKTLFWDLHGNASFAHASCIYNHTQRGIPFPKSILVMQWIAMYHPSDSQKGCQHNVCLRLWCNKHLKCGLKAWNKVWFKIRNTFWYCLNKVLYIINWLHFPFLGLPMAMNWIPAVIIVRTTTIIDKMIPEYLKIELTVLKIQSILRSIIWFVSK